MKMNSLALNRLRIASGMSARALEVASGMPTGNVGRIESGQRSCTAETLRALSEALAAALNKPVSEVLAELTEPEADRAPAA